MSNKKEVLVPSLGESVVEANVASWFAKEGEWVEKDQALLELETDKATVEVVAPFSGLLSPKSKEGETLTIGAVLALIDTEAKKPKDEKTHSDSSAQAAPPSRESKKEPDLKPSPAKDSSFDSSSKEDKLSSSSSSSASLGLKNLSPSQRKAVREGQLSPSQVFPSQEGFFEKEKEERRKMSLLRQKIAERLMFSQKSTATLTTFNEVDLSLVMSLRKSCQEEFQSKFQVKLGFMSFFVKALCYAREEFPIVGARIEGQEIIYSQFMNVSVAVSTERGLVVPVVRRANTLSYSGIEKIILDLAEQAREGKLTPDSMVGGNITLSNGGIFGSLLSTPILNPPQSAILGMHKTEMRPMAVEVENSLKKKEYKLEVRPMMYLALSYDHRLIDGRESVGFLVKVKEYLENVKKKDIFA